MAKTTTKQPYPEVNDIKDDIKSLKENTVELAKHIQKDGTKKGEAIKEKASEQLHTLSEQGKVQLKSMEGKIQEKPLQSIAAAFAAGIALSILFGRR